MVHPSFDGCQVASASSLDYMNRANPEKNGLILGLLTNIVPGLIQPVYASNFGYISFTTGTDGFAKAYVVSHRLNV